MIWKESDYICGYGSKGTDWYKINLELWNKQNILEN